MFKRVEKRRKRKQEEEELGLDEDMKEVLGIHDTDSEESASDSDGSSEDEEDNEQDLIDEGEGDGENEGSDEEDFEEEGEEEEDDEDPNVSVSLALVDPIYVVSVLPEVKACIVCPGKLLKGATMAHDRRFKQFTSLSVNADPKESAWEVLKRDAEEKPKLSLTPSTSSLSKRAQKKQAQQARRKAKREQFKARKAKKALAAASTSTELNDKPAPAKSKKSERVDASDSIDVERPSKKKRKIESPLKQNDSERHKPLKKATVSLSEGAVSDMPRHKRPKDKISSPAQPISPVAVKESTERKESVKTIVRSTSDRAKLARSRALSLSKGGGKRRP